MSNPFLKAKAGPGTGTIHLARLPPDTPRLRTVNYQYPLKLVSPVPLTAGKALIHTVYLLTYGGGLVAGDSINLEVVVEDSTRLVLLTQGSTKLFKSPDREVISRQCMTTTLGNGAALCYLPDPVQPFEKSSFEQTQIYNVSTTHDPGIEVGSLCVLDWVSNGRLANGEDWSFFHYGSKNEIYLRDSSGQRRLLLRDSVLLNDNGRLGSAATRMDGLAIFGTLVMYGPLLADLGQYFLEEFKALPRIGGRKWDSRSESDEEELDEIAVARLERQRQEATDHILWSAASVRGCTVVKFGARSVEDGRKWLRNMLSTEGSLVKLFGERSLLCLR
jgi:urease accessory protein